MKNILLVPLFIFLIQFNSTYAQQNVKPQIALLGTSHFAGTNDMLSVKIDDIQTPKRQAEIQELIDKIKAFKPTKVVLEYPYGRTKLDSLYQLYRKDEHTLSINESQQIGFRLAKQLGHEHIYAADHKVELPFNELMAFINSSGRMDEFNTLIGAMKKEIIEPHEEFYYSHSLTDYFIMLNSEDQDRANRASYTQHLLKYGSDNNHASVLMAEKWWGRNFQIMFNIDQYTEPGDRLFVLFGQGHTAILEPLYRDRTDVEYVEIVDYLIMN